MYIPLFMFLALFIGLLSGIPIAFVLGFISLGFAWVLWGVGGMNLIISAAWGAMNDFTLTAVPLFIFMAMMLEKSGLVTDLYNCFYKWSGGLRGGLAVATILVGTIIGAVSGVIAAGVIGLGLIALPQMEQYKYDRRISLGSVMAGGTLGQLVPPSICMVVYGAITGVSVGKLFAGGVVLGVFLALLYSAYILTRSYFKKDLCPSLPIDNRATFVEKISSLRAIFWPAVLIIAVLGSILSGASTPSEGAAVGALGSVVFSLATRRFRWKIFWEVAIQTLKVTSMVGWIIFSAKTFGSVFSGIGGNAFVTKIATSVPGGPWGTLILSTAFVLFLGMFLETVAMIMLAAPIVSPLLVSLGFDPLWWGLIFMMLLQVAYLSPPFGFALFYLKGVTPPKVTLEEIYWSSLPFIGIQIIGITIVIIFPVLALWLPNLL
jgi:tripartite ATP-independent transporter DctM subunit